MNTIDHIVFDIGKVLVHYEPEIPYRRLIPDAEQRRWFLDNVCTPAWNIEQDRGRSWAEAEAELIARFPDEVENIKAFRSNWHEMVSHSYQDSVNVLLSLIKQGLDVTLLTNFASDTYVEACGRFDFLDRARGVTVSGAVGMIKPDAAIYRHHAQVFDLDPAATLFIDDSAANVEGARACGWKAVQFVGSDRLKKDLADYGFRP